MSVSCPERYKISTLSPTPEDPEKNYESNRAIAAPRLPRAGHGTRTLNMLHAHRSALLVDASISILGSRITLPLFALPRPIHRPSPWCVPSGASRRRRTPSRVAPPLAASLPSPSPALPTLSRWMARALAAAPPDARIRNWPRIRSRITGWPRTTPTAAVTRVIVSAAARALEQRCRHPAGGELKR